MININSVLIPNLSEEHCPIDGNYIVVFADRSTDRLCAINQSGTARKPVSFSYRHILSCLQLGYVSVGTLELPVEYNKLDKFIPDACIRKRDKQFEILLPIIENIEEFLFSIHGSNFVKKIAQENGLQRSQIYTWLYRYLREGQSKNALLPKYTNGVRTNKVYMKKLGRPRKNSDFIGMNISQNDKSNFVKILNKHYLIYGGKPLTACYEELLKDFYSESKSVSIKGNINNKYKNQNETPSINQFRDWARKYFDAKGINASRRRMGATTYDKDYAGRNGEVVRPDGPGQIYQLDSTPGNHELISEFSRDRTLRVGRSTDYKLVDAFSSATVGIHVTLAPPSWAEARIAIFNSIRCKVDFCAEYGIEISTDDWPMQGVPMVIYVDNAELATNLAEGVPSSLCTIKFGRAWRGDDKPLVEKTHDLHATRLRYHVPGHISKSAGERGVPSAKEKALLTLREYTQLLIRISIQRNNHEELDGKWMIREMIKDDVSPRARDLYVWGEVNRPFTKKYITEDEVYLRLLEKGEATIGKEGIYFEGMWYTSRWTLDNGLQNKKAARNKSVPIEIRYLRYNTNYILLCTSEGLKLAELHQNSVRFNNISFEEVEIQLEAELKKKSQRDTTLHESRGDLIEEVNKTVDEAKNTQIKLRPSQVKKQSIATNKSLDLFAQRTRENIRMNAVIDNIYSGEQKTQTQTEQNNSNEIDVIDDPSTSSKNISAYQKTMLELLKGNH